MALDVAKSHSWRKSHAQWPTLHIHQVLWHCKHNQSLASSLLNPIDPQWLRNRDVVHPPRRGMTALQQINSVKSSNKKYFKQPKLDAPDLWSSPALVWQLYFWLKHIFWFANMGSGNNLGAIWPQHRMGALQPTFPEGSVLPISFKTTWRRTWSNGFLFAFHRSRYSNTGGYQKREELHFLLPSLTDNVKTIRTPGKKNNNHKITAEREKLILHAAVVPPKPRFAPCECQQSLMFL